MSGDPDAVHLDNLPEMTAPVEKQIHQDFFNSKLMIPAQHYFPLIRSSWCIQQRADGYGGASCPASHRVPG